MLNGPGPFPVLRHFGFSSVIFLYRLRSPFIAFFLVAHGTGIRNPQLYAQQRIRRIERMIPAGVPSHIQAFRHMAFHTPGTHAGLRTWRMRSHVNNGSFYAVYRFSSTVTPQAERIIFLRKLQCSRMRIMTVQTGHSRLAHTA